MFAENVIPFLTVPYFAIQSKFDKWQLQHELSLPLDYNSWNEGEETYADVDIINYANGLEHNLLHAFDWGQQQKEKQRGGGQQATNNGLFLHSCLLHSIHKLESCYEHIYIDDSDNVSDNDKDEDSTGISIPRRSSSHVNIAVANWIESWILNDNTTATTEYDNERRRSPPIILIATNEVPIDANDVRCCVVR